MSEEADERPGGVEAAHVDWSATGNLPPAPRSVFFDDIYFSGEGPAESAHVFLNGNDLENRFQSACRFCVGELGFGTGLNLLVAWRAWDAVNRKSDRRLDYFSIEKFPLTESNLERSHAAWPDLAAYSDQLRRRLPPLAPGFHRVSLSDNVTLTVFYGDVLEGLERFDGACDAWFLDGFSPAKNPQMWGRDVMAALAKKSRVNATCATFTVAGNVRRALDASGFDLEKQPGFGRKREMLVGKKRSDGPAPPSRAPWFNADQAPLPTGARVAVVGAGVAGASLANRLRAFGLQPVIFETHAPAAGASGNAAGLIMPRLDLGDTAASRFFLQAFIHAVGTINQLSANSPEPIFNQCGVLVRTENDESRERVQRLSKLDHLPNGWMEVRSEGAFFPHGGVVHPPSYVEALIGDAPLVRERINSIEARADGVIIRTARRSISFDAAIIANAIEARRFAEARTLPLQAIAGQLDIFPHIAAPDHAVAAGPYLAPCPRGGMAAGATYEKITPGDAPTPSDSATRENIAAVERLWPNAPALRVSDSHPRASIRCQTPDRLPIVGPAPDWGHYGAAYDDVRFGAQKQFPDAVSRPRIHFLIGLGSRGLVTAPLCAELIASALAGAPSPVGAEIREALHPARFFLRDLKRATPTRN